MVRRTWGTWAACAALLGSAGCSRSAVVQDTSPVTVHRRKLVPEAPSFTSSWRVTPEGITGRIDWRACEHEASWRTRSVRVTRSTTIRNTGAVLVGAAGVMSFVASATYPEPEKRCDHLGCQYDLPDTTNSKVLAGTGLVMLTAGVVMLVIGDRTKVETLADEQKRTSTTGPCISPSELADFVLVLRVGRKLWPMRLEASGEVLVLVPEGTQIPEGVDLEVVVYRAPAGAGDLSLARGRVLQTLRLDPAPPRAPANPAPTDSNVEFPP